MSQRTALFAWIVLASLTLLSGPVAFVASQAGRIDTAGLYVVLSAPFGPPVATLHPELREIGVLRTPISSMVFADAQTHAAMRNSGIFLLPASALATLCGVTI